MNIRQRCGLFAISALLCAVPSAHAEDVLQYLPEDALGFAVVRDLADFNAKAEKIIEIFEMPVPAPLTFVQFATGLSDGLDLDGDVLLALLPGERNPTELVPMVLLPVDDYKKFSASINGDESGEICRVTVAGEEVLIAKQGDYALLMNVEHRESLEVMIDLQPSTVEALKPIEKWDADNDITVALMPVGVQLLVDLAEQDIDAKMEVFAAEAEDEEFEELAKQMEQNLAMSRWFIDLMEAELKVAAIGLTIDEQINIRLADRVIFSESGTLGSIKQIEVGSQSPLAGYADQLYVFAGGGPFPKDTTESLASFSRKLMQSMPEVYGLEDLGEERWGELEAAYRELMQGFESSSVIMLPGEEGQPLFSNFYGIAKVSDAVNKLDSYKKAIDVWNGIMALSTSDIQLQYEVTPTTLGDDKACEVVVDVAAAAQAPNAPMFNWLMETMFGKDGKLRQMMVAADKQTIVYGMADQAELTTVIDAVKKGDTSLSENAQVQTTTKLLPEQAPWKIMVNPTGCVKFVNRVVNEFMVHLNGQTVEIPEFSDCPPVGISVNLVDSRLEADMVWSKQTLKALADFIKACKEL